jgi:hypothetical protein
VAARGTDGVIHSIDARWRTCSFEPDDAPLVGAIWPLLDGSRTIDEVVCSVGFDSVHSRDMLQSLYEHGILVNANNTPVPSLVFHDHATSIGRMWMAMEDSDLFQALCDRPTKRLLLAYLLDHYHYIAGAAAHISCAIANAPNERLRLLLSEHLSEEYWHGIWTASGLRAAGLSERQIEESLPLPATLGAMSFLRLLGTTDPLGYFATLGVRESHAFESPDDARAAWDYWTKVGIVPEEVIAPYRDHQLLDMAHDHGRISAEAFVELPPLTKRQQDDVFRVLVNFARLMGESASAVLRYCEDERNPVPFAPPDL